MQLKSAVLILLLSLTTTSIMAQFGTNMLYHETDTSRWFEVMNDRNDHVIIKLHEMLGEPKQSSAGGYFWTNILIPQFENPCNIRVSDGILVLAGQSMKWDAFESEADKQKKLEHLKENESRSTEIRFVDKGNNNIVRSDKAERACRNYLIGITK